MVTLAGLEPATSPRSPDWKQGRSVPLELQRRYDPHHDLWRHRGERESWARRRLGRIGTDLSTDQFLDRLMVMGIAAAAGDSIGVDDDGIKNFTDQAVWFGQHLGLKRPSRDLEIRVGAWAIDLLNDQPFAIGRGPGLSQGPCRRDC